MSFHLTRSRCDAAAVKLLENKMEKWHYFNWASHSVSYRAALSGGDAKCHRNEIHRWYGIYTVKCQLQSGSTTTLCNVLLVIIIFTIIVDCAYSVFLLMKVLQNFLFRWGFEQRAIVLYGQTVIKIFHFSKLIAKND